MHKPNPPIDAPLVRRSPGKKTPAWRVGLFAVAVFVAAWRPATAAPPTPASEPIFLYTVKAGDELFKMSAESLSTPDDWKEIVILNQLPDANAIQIGQILKIPLRLIRMAPVNARLVSASGDVRLGGNRVGAGMAVPEGSQLQTGRNSSAVLELADGSRVTFLPNTLAELATSRGQGSMGGNTAASSAASAFSGLMRLSTGVLETLAAKIANRSAPLQIQTPTSLVGVRGTQFRVAYDDPASQSARTEVLEGTVRADNPAQSNGTDIAQGKGSVFNAAVNAIAVVDLPKAPDLSALPELLVKPEAIWPMPTAAGYKVFRAQIAGDSNFDSIVRDVLVKNGNAAFPDLPNGQWFARVRSVRDDTIEGYDTVKLVQVVLPMQPGQPPRQWTITDATLEMVDGKQTLIFRHVGLGSSHAVVASVRLAQPPFLRIEKVVFKGDAQDIRMELGAINTNAPLELNLTVAQQDGALVFPVDYAFSALAAPGRAEAALKRLPGQSGVLQRVSPSTK